MKKLSSSIAAILIIAASYSQSGYSYEIINDENVRKKFGPINSDPDGNTIISGQFETTITLGGTTLSGGTYGYYNAAFVAKVLPGGSFAWVKAFYPLSIPNSLSSITVNGITTDAAGNIYVTGGFKGKIGFGVSNVSLSSTRNGNTYTGDIFTVKMSASGIVLWAKSAGTANNVCNAGETGRSVTTDNSGNVYVTGVAFKVFKNTTACNEPPGSTCTNATYVVKYNAAGTKIWEKIYSNNGTLAGTTCWVNHSGGLDIRTDGTNIYVTGSFKGTVTFGNVNLSTGSDTTSNLFLLKLDGNGNTIWARSVTGSYNNGYIIGYGLLVDGNEIYIRGIFQPGTISLGECSLTDVTARGYLAKYSSAGTCQWAIIPFGIPYGVVKISNGNLAMLLRLSPEIGWGYGIKELSPGDGSTVNFIYPDIADTATATIGGYPSFAKLPDGFVFSHHIQGTLHFGDLTITSTGSYDNMMLIKYSATPPPVARKGNIIPETSSDKIVLYPNPTSNQVTIQNNNNKLLGTLSIYDISGKMIYKKFVGSSQTTIDVKNFSSGVYYLRSDQMEMAIKFVKQQ